MDAHEESEVKSYLNMLNYHGINVTVSTCMFCGLVIGAKDGRGNHGIKHEVCEKCKTNMKEVEK